MSSVKLEAFHKFADSTEALKSVAKMLKGKIPSNLKSFLEENVVSKEIRDTIMCTFWRSLSEDRR